MRVCFHDWAVADTVKIKLHDELLAGVSFALSIAAFFTLLIPIAKLADTGYTDLNAICITLQVILGLWTFFLFADHAESNGKTASRLCHAHYQDKTCIKCGKIVLKADVGYTIRAKQQSAEAAALDEEIKREAARTEKKARALKALEFYKKINRKDA